LETLRRTTQGKLIRQVLIGSGLEPYDNARSQRLNEKKVRRNNVTKWFEYLQTGSISAKLEKGNFSR
jgi:hypothetical protein